MVAAGLAGLLPVGCAWQKGRQPGGIWSGCFLFTYLPYWNTFSWFLSMQRKSGNIASDLKVLTLITAASHSAANSPQFWGSQIWHCPHPSCALRYYSWILQTLFESSTWQVSNSHRESGNSSHSDARCSPLLFFQVYPAAFTTIWSNSSLGGD